MKRFFEDFICIIVIVLCVAAIVGGIIIAFKYSIKDAVYFVLMAGSLLLAVDAIISYEIKK